MNRILSLASPVLIGVLVLLGLVPGSGTRPAFAGKPSIAVLGLEVVDDGSGLDAKMTSAAKELTDALRRRPKSGTGPYDLAKGADKDLAELKFIRNCETEAKDCMAQIGGELSAAFLLYGKLEKRSGGVQVSLKLFDVGSKQLVRSSTDLIPNNQLSATDLERASKSFYTKIIGAASTAAVMLKVTPVTSRVLIDGEAKTVGSDGTVRLSDLPDGEHTYRVERDGYAVKQGKFSAGGSDMSLSIELTKLPKVTPPGGGDPIEVEPDPLDGIGPGSVGPGIVPKVKPKTAKTRKTGGGWRKVFYASAVVAVGAGAVFGYYAKGLSDTKAEMRALGADEDNNFDCGQTQQQATCNGLIGQGNSQETKTWIFGIGAGLAAGVGLVAFYKGFVASEEVPMESEARRGKPRKARFAVSPVVSPNSAGATVRFDF